MNGGAAQHVATVTLPGGLAVSLVGGGGGGPAVGGVLPHEPRLTPATTRQRKYNFSFKEKELLVTLIERHGGVVESRTGDGVTSEQKMAAWADVQARFNQLNWPAQERSGTELKKCYWNLKQKTKKALDAARESGGQGKVDRVLWRIAQLAPEQFEGLLDLHCELVDATPENELKGIPPGVRPEKLADLSGSFSAPTAADSVESSDREASNTSPVPAGGSPSPAEPGETDDYPVIPSDYLSVELSTPPPPQTAGQDAAAPALSITPSSAPAPGPAPAPTSASLLPAAAAPALASLAEQWRAAAAGVWTPPGLPELHRLVNGYRPRPLAPAPPQPPAPAPEPRGAKRPSSDPADAAAELRRLEHEYKMRLLRREAEYMEARHALQMQVLEQQRLFWSEALVRSRLGDQLPLGL